jgi:hypothetical protein
MRLYDNVAGKPLPDLSTKQWVFRTSDGIAAVAYAGIGRLSTGDHVSNLMVRLLRGQSRTMNETLLAIRGFANDRLAHIAWDKQWEHSFIVGAYVNNRPWAGVITNQELVRLGYPQHVTRLRQSFEILTGPVGTGLVLTVGTRRGLRESDWAQLRRAAHQRARRFDNYLNLLGHLTKRAAARLPDYISEQSHVVYLPPPPVSAGGPEWHHRVFDWGAPVPSSSQPSYIVHGLDLTSALNRLWVKVTSGSPPKTTDAFLDAFQDVIRLEPGVPIRDKATGSVGSIAIDPVPGGDDNDIGIRWADNPKEIVVVNRRTIVALYPEHPDLM